MERNPDIASILCQSLGPSLNQGSTETTSDCTQTTVIGSFYTEFSSYILWSFIRVSSLKCYSVLMWGDSPLKPSSTSPTSPSYSCALWGKKNTITFLNKRCVKRTASGHTFTSKCSFTPIPPTTKWKKGVSHKSLNFIRHQESSLHKTNPMCLPEWSRLIAANVSLDKDTGCNPCWLQPDF